MDLLSELRNPTTRLAKLIAAILALLLFWFLAEVTISGFLLYRVLSPAEPEVDLSPENLLGHPSVVSFAVPGGGTREGWFFPGLRTAPTIILCHGYQSHRAEIVTLVSALQEHQFNVFLFDFAGHGKTKGFTAFGYSETRELLAAVAAIAQRDDVDHTRFGVWGSNLGGYAAIAAAASDSRIRAFAVDSVYDEPIDMLRFQLVRSGLGILPLVEKFCVAGYRLIYFPYRKEPPLSQRLSRLVGVGKLFIVGSDTPALAVPTRELFLKSPEPREQWILPRANFANLIDQEKRAYENRVANFFLQVLPPAGRSTR